MGTVVPHFITCFLDYACAAAVDPLAGSSCCPAIRAREAAVLALAAFFVAVMVFVMNGGGRFPI